ncbi:SmtA SAM-dependent methyltransferases [Methylophilaceae bacterium]
MNCPLCNTNKSLITKRTSLLALKSYWLSSFGFDPFPSDFLHKNIDKRRCVTCRLEYYDPSFFGDAGFYEKISKHPWYYEQDKWEFDVAADAISHFGHGNLLEIGCGNGYFLEKVSLLGLDVEGVDINRDAVATCKAKGLNVDAINIFEIKKSYDTVVLFQVLEHMENAKEIFEFLTTKLIRSGGHLIIAVPNPDGYLKEMGVNLLDMPPHHNSCWGLSTFEYLNSQFGLQLLDYQKEPIRYVHYLGLLNTIIGDQSKLTSRTLRVKLFNRLQLLLVNLFAPLTYMRDRNQMVGQTHLVVLKNAR